MEDLQQLYRQCRPDIYRYLLLLTRSPAAAEDLTQEVFLTALQKLPAFRGGLHPPHLAHRHRPQPLPQLAAGSEAAFAFGGCPPPGPGLWPGL